MSKELRRFAGGAAPIAPQLRGFHHPEVEYFRLTDIKADRADTDAIRSGGAP